MADFARSQGRGRARPQGGTSESQARRYDGGDQGSRGVGSNGRGGRGGFQGGRGGSSNLERGMENLRIGGGRRKFMTPEERRQQEIRNYDLVSTRGNQVTKSGTKGQKIALVANYFTFTALNDSIVFKYRVDFTHDDVLKDRTATKRWLLSQHKKELPVHVFDGSLIFTNVRLFPDAKKQMTLSSELPIRDEKGAERKEIVQITIKFVGEATSKDHDYVHFYNIVFRRALDLLGLQMMNRNYYDPGSAQTVPGYNLEVWLGYVTTISQRENQLMLNAEIGCKILRTDSALASIKLILDKTKSPEAVRRELVGAIVITHYNKKHYSIDDVDFNLTPMSTFDRGGEQVTYAKYFKERYNLDIKDKSQPMLISKPKEKDRRGGQEKNTVLVPELAMMTGLTDQQRADFKLNKALSGWTRMDPNGRVNAMLKFVNRLKSTPAVAQELKAFGMDLHPKMVEFHGRVLPAEAVSCRDIYKNTDGKADWTEMAKNGLFSSKITLAKWVLIFPSQEKHKMMEFYSVMLKDAPRLGLTINDPKFAEVRDTRIGSYVEKLNEFAQRGANFFMVVIPNERGEHYAVVKKKLCTEFPIPSQVITVSKILNKDSNKYRSFATKIMIQIATKLGAIPWSVAIPLKRGTAMVVGFDSYHEKEGDLRGKTVGALVASYDESFGRYYSKTTQNEGETELCNQMQAMLTECLHHFKKANNCLPSRVFFYRDGVGEGQVQEVLDKEVSAIQKVLKDPSVKATLPDGIKLTFIIVSKRINTRFMAKQGNGAMNPPCGTVVDDVITRPERYDFFLVSQSVLQGTVNPTMYNVITDESGLSPDNIQALTYKLTHLYFNMSSTVRVPAPCLYAHKLADLVGKNLKRSARPELNDMLYFL